MLAAIRDIKPYPINIISTTTTTTYVVVIIIVNNLDKALKWPCAQKVVENHLDLKKHWYCRRFVVVGPHFYEGCANWPQMMKSWMQHWGALQTGDAPITERIRYVGDMQNLKGNT